MNTYQLRKTLFATALAFGLVGAVSNAMAQSEHEGHHPETTQPGKPAAQQPQPGEMQGQGIMNKNGGQMPHGDMMEHDGMDHDQMMNHMHDPGMETGQGKSSEKGASDTKGGN